MKETRRDKILNDPIYGFITLKKGIIFQLIEHRYFQRLRRISQLGLSYLVYPGAHHTRFQHAIGCMHLMNKAITQIKNKGHEITKKESIALHIAILLHDIGHGPFSHVLEKSIVQNITHEEMSLLFMKKLNKEFKGNLTLGIKIFQNQYHKKFLHQLVSSQLDVDRLDYLKRDSFFTGVVEGNIGADRIINMLNVVNDQLVLEEKGIYSIEQFLIARRLMYWQVYLHKTVLSTENMLMKILQRAKKNITSGKNIYTTKSLHNFLSNNYTLKELEENSSILDEFSLLDDHDILTCLKEWKESKDVILAELSSRILDRKPLKIKIQNQKFQKKEIEEIKEEVIRIKKVKSKEISYLVFSGKVSNNTYKIEETKINILMKDKNIKDIAKASDQFNIETLSKTVNKYFLCYPEY